MKDMKNGVNLENRISLTQSSKGIWYCKEVTVYGGTKLMEDVEEIIIAIEELLFKQNGEQ